MISSAPSAAELTALKSTRSVFAKLWLIALITWHLLRWKTPLWLYCLTMPVRRSDDDGKTPDPFARRQVRPRNGACCIR